MRLLNKCHNIRGWLIIICIKIKREGESIGIEVSEKEVLGKPKSRWKEQVKRKVREAFDAELENKKWEGRKLRFLGTKGSETYLNEIHNDNARLAVKIRLNMVDWIETNYGVAGVCPLCGEEDSTKRVFWCDLEDGQKMDKIVDLFKKTETCRKNKLLENVMINFDVLRRE